MDISWILLALFLVALIWGVKKSLGRSVVKNAMRLGSVIVAFVITLVLQMCGVFQGIVQIVADALSGILNLEELLGGFAGAIDIVVALASTVVGMIFFSITFFVLLSILRIIVHFVANAIDRAIEKKAQASEAVAAAETQPEATQTVEAAAAIEAEAETAVEEQPVAEETTYAEAQVPTEEKVESVEAVEAAEPEAAETVETVEAVEAAEAAEAAEPEVAEPAKTVEPVAEATEPVAAIKAEKQPKPKKEQKPKKKIKGFYPECAWKKAISIATGAISSLLILAMVLMPVFYTMSIAGAATAAIEDSDAKDSQIYKIVDVADKYVVDSYESSFVYQLYNLLAITDLMNYAVKSGGQIVLDSGEVVYADDVLKNLITHGVSAAMQITSAESECKSIRADVQAIVSDPMISSVLADVLIDILADLESEEPSEDDLVAGLVNNFTIYYKNADKATIEKDLQAVAGAVGVLAEDRILAMLVSGNVDTDALLSDRETLGNVVEAISGLSAFGSTVEGAFELGIGMLGESLHIPENDVEVYEQFMDELAAKMAKDTSSKYTSNDYSAIQDFMLKVAKEGKKVSSYKNTSGYNKFISYYNQWAKIQSAFAHASEDRSYGYLTMQLSDGLYVYDHQGGKIVKIEGEAAQTYKNKISPIEGIINELTIKAKKTVTRDDIYSILESYSKSLTADEVSRELAVRILAKESFTSKAVTLEKLLAATDFSAWSDDEIKAKDSRLCVDIIMDLLGIMETLGNIEGVGGLEGARDLVDYFVVLGSTLDKMGETSCIDGLPELLIEGLIKSDMLSDFIAPSIAFQSIELVKNNEAQKYVDVMARIAAIIEMGLNSIGGAI